MIAILSVLSRSLLSTTTTNPCAEFAIGDGPQITKGIPQPGWTTAQLDTWWTKMKACRTFQLQSVQYNGTAFKNPDLDWTQRAFAIPMVQAYDRFLYDEQTKTYTVDRLVDDLETRYGGADAVFLWPTYTNIGMDNRNQLDLFRAMPGGIKALNDIASAFHKRGVHVMWGYNPWDTGTEREPHWMSVTDDALNVITALKAAAGDGFNMDTMGHTPPEWPAAAKLLNYTVAYQAEGGGSVATMEYETMNTCHCSYTKGVQSVDHYKFLDARRMTSVRDRWGLDHTSAFQHAFFNGVGFETTENDWGQCNIMTYKNAETYKRINTILRRFLDGGLLTSQEWRPHVPGVLTTTQHVFASTFPSTTLRTEQAWLFVNRGDVDVHGAQIRLLASIAGAKTSSFYDCWRGTPLAVDPKTSTVSFTMPANGYGCVVRSANSSTAGSGAFATFLARMRELYAVGPVASLDDNFHPLQQTMSRRPRTPAVAAPKGMVAIPSPPAQDGVASVYRFAVNTVKNQAETVLSSDAQFFWEAQGRKIHEATIPIEPFYIDESPVTCGAWDAYVKESGYTPSDPFRYLHNWVSAGSGGGGPNSSSSTFTTPTLPPALASVPVTYISFQEASAYCAHYEKRLPHDWEWQYAAQGFSDGRVFPWPANASCAGDDAKGMDHCAAPLVVSRELPRAPNTGAYSPQSDSPFGVKDLIRSVWQFTDEVLDSHSHAAIVRGGSNWRAGINGTIGSHWWVISREDCAACVCGQRVPFVFAFHSHDTTLFLFFSFLLLSIENRYFFPTSEPVIEHNKYELMSASYERAGTLGFRCVADVSASATRCGGRRKDGEEVCGRWDGPPVFNTSLSSEAGDGGEWARWAVDPQSRNLTTVGPSSIPTASRRIGEPRPACGQGDFGAADTGIVTFGWSGGDSSSGSDVTNTSGAMSSHCGFEIEVEGSGIEGGETLSLWGGIDTTQSHPNSLGVTAAVGSGNLWTQLVPIAPSAHSRSGGASRADALVRFAWPSAKGTTLKLTWVAVKRAPTPGPTPKPSQDYNYTAYPGKVCGVPLDDTATTSAVSEAACEAMCNQNAKCSCAMFDAEKKVCGMRATCVTTTCVDASAQQVSLVKDYTFVPHHNCYEGHGATNLDGNVPRLNVTIDECIAWCESDLACTAAQYKTPSISTKGEVPAKSCWRRADVVLSNCDKKSDQNVYLRPSVESGGAGDISALLYAAALTRGPVMPSMVGY